MRNIIIILACAFSFAFAQTKILVNAVGYEKSGVKRAVIQSNSAIAESDCNLVDQQGNVARIISLEAQTTVSGWSGRYFKVADFSDFNQNGKYRLKIGSAQSEEFSIGEKILQEETGSYQISFFKGMRNTSAGDRNIRLHGTSQYHNIYGGWNDATGDRGKHLSHLSYANYFNPQQIPFVAWALLNASELQPSAFGNAAAKEEAAWGADYLLRSLSAEGYFYMSVFDEWNQSSNREICAWSGSAGTRSSDYQSAMREGAGVSIAALARTSKMGISGDSASAQYLAGAKRAYAHLKANPLRYQDNGKENIIDDYCGLLAASELYNATNDPQYSTDANTRAQSLLNRQHSDGWFYTENAAQNRPFYHAADEGLPIVALARYVEVVQPSNINAIQAAIKKNLLWYVNITYQNSNPFEYAKMYRTVGTTTNPGAVDLARGQTATASRSEANYAANLAFDGISTTRWSSYENGQNNDNQWIAVDLGEVYKVNKVVLNWETACGKDYNIEVSSNNTNWAAVKSVTDNISAGKKEYSIAPVDARYVRMFGLTRCIEYGGFSLFDFEVYGEQTDNAPPSPYQARFFMPHSNETGYWWQGENARIASLSAAFTIGARQLADPNGKFWNDTLFALAITQLDWILGKNPFGVSMMFGFGSTNYPDYPATNPISNIKGGICNGITAKHGNENDLAWNDVEGLEPWDNWRYIEQWLPHNAWYLTAIAALSHRIENPIVPPVSIKNAGRDIKLDINGDAQVSIYNLRGQKLLSYGATAGNAAKMPSSMAKGVYLLNIKYASGKNTTLRICVP
jgi:hypothetical protein